MKDGSDTRERIAEVVRALRRERRWTQAELAKKLGISQGRLSQIESGSGSFSAEQLLLIFRLFNVTPARFGDAAPSDGSELQDALARLGAGHLYENGGGLPSTRVDDVSKTVGETLSGGDPRLIAALAPVIVANIDHIALPKLLLDLSRTGFERRLPWLCENIAHAIDSELRTDPPRPWAKQARRAATVIGLFLEATTPPGTEGSMAWDALDAGIRSMKTAVEIKNAASGPARRWRIITALTPEDFAVALRDSRAAHP